MDANAFTGIGLLDRQIINRNIGAFAGEGDGRGATDATVGAELINELPLAAAITRALIAEEGDLRAALRSVRAYERGAWDQTPYGGLTTEVISTAYVAAVSWAESARVLISV